MAGAVVTLVGTEPALAIGAVTVTYRGVVALDAVSLAAPVGRITGLIGPNGAGKTTLFNACSGIVRPDSGSIRYGSDDITRAAPARRAQLGLGRTFQRMELFESLTVRANVALGREAVLAGSNPLRHLWATRAERDEIQRATDAAMQRCDIDHLAEKQVPELSTGERRLVELARCVAADRALLLLDEPSSGLDHVETERFGQVLKSLVHDSGVGILLVEHDMALVMAACDHIYVLDFGTLVFDGTPAEVRGSDLVRRAYLGDEL